MKWIAHYIDGSHLQHDIDNTEEKGMYEKINRSKLKAFEIVDDLGDTMLLVHIPENGRLIYRRRVQVTQGGGERSDVPYYIVGCQSTVNGHNSQFICLVSPTKNQVEVFDRWRDDIALISKPIIHPHENEEWEDRS